MGAMTPVQEAIINIEKALGVSCKMRASGGSKGEISEALQAALRLLYQEAS